MVKLKWLNQFLKLGNSRFSALGVLTIICIIGTSCDKSLEDKMGDYVNRSKSGDTLRIADFSNFKWDEVWIISPNMHKKSIGLMKDSGINTLNIKNLEEVKLGLGIRWAEYMDALVFIYKNKIVYRCYPSVYKPRTVDWSPRFDFQYPKNVGIIINSKDEAVFHIKKGTLIPIN